jgi:hypothetical protein
MPIQLGCQFTLFYFTMGFLGSLIAVWVLPGCYTELPSICKVRGKWRIQWAVLARLLTGGIFGCIADRNGVNAFFAGFFCWHVFKWLSEKGWEHLESRLNAFWQSLTGKKGG